MDSPLSSSKRKEGVLPDPLSDDDGFEIPKEHLKMARKRLKVSRPEAIIQKSQSKTTMSDVRNLLLWVLTDSHGTIPRWCMVRNKNLVSSVTVIVTPFIDRHTLFETAGNSVGISEELPFFSHCIRGSLIPMSAVPFGRYPSVCPVLAALLSSPPSGKNSGMQWVDKLSDNEEDATLPEELSKWTIADFLMSEENCRANDMPDLLPGGRCPPGFVSTLGKKTRKGIVHSDELNMLLNQKDMDRLSADPDYCNLFGMDCEMVDTIAGKELARVSLVNHLGQVVYDSIVLPENEVTDYLTMYSGITAKMIRECKTSFSVAQKELLTFLDEKSILVGHAIDNDLKCLRLIHNRLIDTSDIFPHPNGHPSKHSLVFLLQRVLRESLNREGGHDSIDDARAALRIAMKKLARGFDYAPLGMGSSKQVPLGSIIAGPLALHAKIDNPQRYKLDGFTLGPGTQDTNPNRLEIHHYTQFQTACESNSSRRDALVETDAAICRLVSNLPATNVIVVLSGCGDVHALKKFEALLAKCEDEKQRDEVTRAVQKAKEKAVSAFTIVSTVGELPEAIRSRVSK